MSKTVEDYLALGVTKDAARWLAEHDHDPISAQDYLARGYTEAEAQRLVERDSGQLSVKDYMAQGYTMAGAAAMVARAAGRPQGPPAPSTFCRADHPPLERVSFESQATMVEWIMLSVDRESFVGAPDDGPVHRWDMMLAWAPKTAHNLRRAIATGKIEPVAWGFTSAGQLDDTCSTLDRATMLDFFQRVGGYDNKIAELLAERDRQASNSEVAPEQTRPGPKNGEPPVNRLASSIALAILDDDEQRPPRKHGLRVILARRVNKKLSDLGHKYEVDSIRKIISLDLREWEKKNPDK